MSDVILYKEDIDRLNAILQHLVHETKILSVILVNKDTRLLASQGTLALFDMSALAALIVGSYASTQGIAGLIGEKEFTMMSHCGKSKNLLITLVDDDTICAAVFSRSVSLSAVSSSVAKHIEELRAALLAIKHNMDSMFQGPVAMPSLSLSPEDVEKGFDNFFDAPGVQDEAAAQSVPSEGFEKIPQEKPPVDARVEARADTRADTRVDTSFGTHAEIRPQEQPIPPPQETRRLEYARSAAASPPPQASPVQDGKMRVSELDRSISSNAGVPSPYKNIPPPSNTEYLYFTSMNFLKNKAKQGSTHHKNKSDKSILSRFFNRGKQS
jgi:predicted regulator of Ras-like GTPase activity (Roadblock/LC7/MglB family)